MWWRIKTQQNFRFFSFMEYLIMTGTHYFLKMAGKFFRSSIFWECRHMHMNRSPAPTPNAINNKTKTKSRVLKINTQIHLHVKQKEQTITCIWRQGSSRRASQAIGIERFLEGNEQIRRYRHIWREVFEDQCLMFKLDPLRWCKWSSDPSYRPMHATTIASRNTSCTPRKPSTHCLCFYLKQWKFRNYCGPSWFFLLVSSLRV